ncbi:MAG: Neuropathy target esterase, partial [Paramarteilia canceri]
YSQSTIVSSSILAKKFGIQNSNNLEHISSTRITHFLSTAEDENKILIMITDSESMTKWNIHALEQADVIIVAINFEDQPYSPQALELKIMNQELKTTREIVFLHSHSTKQIRNTKQWLQSRKGYHMHFHVRCDESFFDYATSNSDKIESCSHIGRLARYLTGKTVGIACGGGGAKGFAHLGVLKAFSESNIPIDMITGTSMGAFLGGLWAMCEDLEEVYRQTTEAVNYSKSWLIYCFDLTLPVVSIFTGRQFGYILKQVFGDCNLEDFWTPYMCVTTDLTEECGKAHNFGSAALFIQASMTLIGYVPPVSDPSNNHLLVDGGYTNNVPGIFLINSSSFYFFLYKDIIL